MVMKTSFNEPFPLAISWDITMKYNSKRGVSRSPVNSSVGRYSIFYAPDKNE